MSKEIKSIRHTGTFDIIQTDTDFYYSPKTDRANPRRLNLNHWRDTIVFHLPNLENSEYWAYNLLATRNVMHLYRGSQEIYRFEDWTKTNSRLEMVCVGFHVLNDRWVVVLEYCERDRTFICRTYDILKKMNTQSHMLLELRATSYNDIKSYSYAGEYILVMTSTHLAKIRVAPDNGTGLTCLDYKVTTNNIGLNQQAPREDMLDISFKHIRGLGSDGTQTSQINVYMQRSDFDDRSFHSIRSQKSFIGTINPETLDNTRVVPNPTELLLGGVEYLAPDIAIHRPDLLGLTQYFTLMVSDVQATSQAKQATSQQKLIQVNIHDYEPRKEQRRLYARHWDDDGRFFTLICSKWLGNHLIIYQVDRLTRTIGFMNIKTPANGTVIEIQPGDRITISEFDLSLEIVRVIEPTKTDISAVLTGIPITAAELIAKFAEKKIINY